MNGVIKNRRAILAMLAAVCILCAGAIYADLEIGHYASGNFGSIAQPAPPSLEPNGAYSVTGYPIYKPNLAAAEGEQDTAAYCNTCHSPNYITMQPPLPAATWESEVNKMEKSYGAQFPTDVHDRIIKYLQTNYSTETRKLRGASAAQKK